MNALTKQEGGALALQEAELLDVLESSLYPGASPASIRLVLGYCKAAALDPMEKPVHIVPMWDSKAQRMRDVVMPGVNLYRVKASRTGQLVGMSEPDFGPDRTEEIGGQRITYPEWCRVTVRRLVGGVVAEFTAREFWTENYAVKGGKEKSIAPNAMWTKRPRGQIAKCAEAQALRKGFPEVGAQPTAEEMEGKQLHPDDAQTVVIEQVRQEPETWPADKFTARIPKWRDALAAGQAHDAIVAFARSRGALTAEQEKTIRGLTPTPAAAQQGEGE